MPRTPFKVSPAAGRNRRHRRQARHDSSRNRLLRLEPLESRQLLASISGHVVYDLDGNGAVELDEPGLADWRVYVDENNNGVFDEGEVSSFTDSEGLYRLEDLGTGFHVVAREPQAGWQQSYPLGTGKWTVAVLATQDVEGYDFGQRRNFTPFQPGNLLVTRSSFGEEDFVLEYTPQGTLVQALLVPGSQGQSTVTAKDLVMDSRGRLQIFNGYEDVRLTTFDPSTASFADAAVPIWDMGRTVDAWGDIAAVGNFVFVNEHLDDLGVANGLIRFNVDDLSFERFSGSFAFPTDVTAGLDGLLYTLNASFNNTTVHVHDPTTMEAVRTFNIDQRLGSLAVDAEGNLYATTDAGLAHFDPSGQLVKSTLLASGDDIAISRDGLLALTSNLRVDLIDTGFASVSSFPILGNATINFTAFSAFVQQPVDEGAGTDDRVDYGVFTPGNILVSNSPLNGDVPTLYEYTPFGQLVREYEVPLVDASGPRDVVADRTGNVYLFNGTFSPRLTRFDPHVTPGDDQPAGFTEHLQFPGWNTAENPAFGGLASFGDFVFATDTKTQRDTSAQRGIVRYDVGSGVLERFYAEHGSIIDVAVGLDGLLYTLGPANDSVGTLVRRYHPVTMQLLGTISLPVNHRAIAVDANGDIFAAYPDIHHYNSAGVVQRTALDDGGVGGLADIDIDADGRLLIAAQDGHILVTDRHFTSLYTFLSRSSDGTNFATFLGPRQAVKAAWDAWEVDANSSDNPLDVLANDRLEGAGSLSITAVGSTSAGGSVTIADGTELHYTPAAGFVGIETFTYTISDSLGGSDQGQVQVAVNGTASFFAVDDAYATAEDVPLIVPPGVDVLVNDGRLDIFPVLTSGNILVVHSPVGTGSNALLQEYQPDGTLVPGSTVQLPDFSDGGFADVRDVVVDRSGRVQIFNGTLEPRLTTFDPVTRVLTHQTFANWNTSTNVTFGGLAAWRNFLFATDQRVGADTSAVHAGIVRFDIETGTATRFISDGDFIDVNVGLDGLVYALGPAGPPAGQYIRVYQPQSMQMLRQIQVPASLWDLRAITADENGQIYGVRYRDPSVYHLSAGGTILRSYNTGMGSEADFSDIDLDETGQRLLIANINFSNTTNPNDGDVVLVRRSFFGQPTILQAPDASSDMKFAAWVQAPVGALNRPLTVSAYTQPSHGTLVLTTGGAFDYTPEPDYSGSDQFTYVVRDADGQQRRATVALTVTAANDPPVLVPAAPADQSDENLPYTVPLTSFINGGAATTTIGDADPNDPLGGIAVRGLSGEGTWAYSIGGTVFVNIGVVSDDQALLLPHDAYIRFTPNGSAGGSAALDYRAWDTTLGSAGNKFDTTFQVCLVGGDIDPETGLCLDGELPEEYLHGAFSEAWDTLSLSLTDLNDAPLLVPSMPLIGSVDEHTTLTARLDAFVTGVLDPDTGERVQGLALVDSVGNGLWEYSLDGQVFLPLPAIEEQSALLLDADDLLRYSPDMLNGETAYVTYRAWDKSDGQVAGGEVDVSQHGGTTAYSQATDTARVRVTDVNDAPLLTPSGPSLGTTDVITPLAAEVNQFAIGISDVDRDSLAFGIAITGTSGLGSWEYSLDGSHFAPLPAVSDGAALLLYGNDVLRYVPDGLTPELASVRYRAWDTTQAAAGQVVDVSFGGDATAFSENGDTAWVTVLEVNDPPVLSGPIDPLDYAESDPPLAVFSAVQVADEDSPDFDGGSLTVSLITGGSGQDRLSLLQANGVSLSGGNVLYDSGGGPQAIGTLSLQGFNLTVNFSTAHATLAAVQAVARSVAYANVSENPSSATRLLRLTLIDGDQGSDSTSLSRAVRVLPVNDPPQTVGEIYTVSMTGSLAIGAGQGVLANDVDAEQDPLTALLVTAPQGGTLNLHPDGSFTYSPHPLFFGLDTFAYKANDGQAESAVTAVGVEVLLPNGNPSEPGDVNGDAFLSPLDALQAANYLAQHGSGPIPQSFSPPPFIDVNQDGMISQVDVTRAAVIVEDGGPRPVPPPRLEFPQQPAVLGPGHFVQLRLQASDAAGEMIASIPAGEDFFLDVWVEDLRGAPLGVFAAYLDVSYDPELVTVGGPLVAGADYPRFLSGSLAVDGSIDEAGGGRIDSLADAAEHLLLRIPLTAESRGTAEFAADAADQLPAHDVLLFGIEGPIALENIRFLPTQLQISGPPQAEHDFYTAAEDLELIVTAAAGVLANDVDDQGDPLQAVLVAGPQHGQVTLQNDGSFHYIPDPDYFGSDHFTYKANDGFFDSDEATVTITITGSDDFPIAADDNYTALIDHPLTIAAGQGVLANDVELDGQVLQARLVESPQHGSLQLAGDGSFVYTPAPGYAGPDQFRYVANDGALDSGAATVHLDVLFDWINPTHPVDVNGDGWLSPLDALLVFNDLERRGGSYVPPHPPLPPDMAPPFLDTSDDGMVSIFDGLLVVEQLAQQGARLLPEPRLSLPQATPELGDDPLARFRLETTDAAGEAAAEFNLGQTFYVNVYVSDLRTLANGAFSAYLDLVFDTAGLEAAGTIEYGAAFPIARTGLWELSGLDAVGGMRSALAHDASEQLLVRIPLAGTAEGQYSLQSTAAGAGPAGEITLAGIDAPIPAEYIDFGQAAITIVMSDADGDGVQDAEEDAAPGQGDANADGIPDSQQSHVASLRSAVSQKYVTIVAASTLQLRNVRASGEADSVTPPSGVTFPHGFFAFDVAGLTSGGSASLTWLLEAGAVANAYYRFGPTAEQAQPHLAAHLLDGDSGASIYADRIELLVADGLRGDDDLAANGAFTQHGSPAMSTRPWSNPVLNLDVNNSGIVSPLDALILINEINAGEARQLPLLPQGQQSLPPFLDVNADGWLAPNDVLTVINYLNAPAGTAGEGEAAAASPAAALLAVECNAAFATGGSWSDESGTAQTIELAEIGQRQPLRRAVDRLFAEHGAARERLRSLAERWKAKATDAEERLGLELESALCDIADDLSGHWGRIA